MLQYWWQSASILLGYAVYALAKSEVSPQPPLDLASIAIKRVLATASIRRLNKKRQIVMPTAVLFFGFRTILSQYILYLRLPCMSFATSKASETIAYANCIFAATRNLASIASDVPTITIRRRVQCIDNNRESTFSSLNSNSNPILTRIAAALGTPIIASEVQAACSCLDIQPLTIEVTSRPVRLLSVGE